MSITPAGTTECGRVQTHNRDPASRWARHRHLPLRIDRIDGAGQAGGAGLARRRRGAPALVRGGRGTAPTTRPMKRRSTSPAMPSSRSSTFPTSRRTSPSTSSTMSTRRFGAPGRDRQTGRARHHRHEPRHRRRLDLRQGADAREVPRPPAGLVRSVGPRDPRRQPVRPPGLGAEDDRRHEHPGAPRDRGAVRRRNAGGER